MPAPVNKLLNYVNNDGLLSQLSLSDPVKPENIHKNIVESKNNSELVTAVIIIIIIIILLLHFEVYSFSLFKLATYAVLYK